MNLSHWVAHRAGWSGDKVAVRFEGAEITYGALDRRVRRIAAALRHGLGILPGDRVAHLGTNSPDLLALLFACARIGAMLVPLNWRLAPPEHAWILGDCRPKALLVEPEFLAHVEAMADRPAELALVAWGAPPSPAWRGWDALLAAAPGDAAEPSAGPDSAVEIVYTSGTTGRPKGAVLTQGSLFHNALNALAAHDLTSADHVLTTLPMFHVGGMNIQTTPAILAGATVTLHRRFEAGAALREIAASRPTLFLAVPAVIAAMVAHPDWAGADLASLRVVATGSSTVPEALLHAFLDRGIATTQVYGATESGPVSIVTPIAEAWRKAGSVGKPALACAARIADAGGGKGEILLRGPHLFREYWNNPAATAAAFDDGWLRTGDIGHVDSDGFFYVDDRKTDVIISGGENIYPAELENVLAECPMIAESAVVGRPDARWGEIPVACIVARAGAALDEAAILALFEGRIARYKHPRAVVFLPTLPRNAMGKVLKYALREALSRSA